jgi:hypothetical protein
MNDRINKLVQSVLGKNSLGECSLSELEELAEKHPYFGAAQLLLAKKLQDVDEVKYTRQVEKASLFFHNPLWLNNLLNDNDVSAPAVLQTVEVKQEPVTVVPEPPKKEEILFEPFHTVDYFASQGIKIRDEELVKDKLGKQLKSFTEWLKTMKKLPVAEMEKRPSSSAEQKVEQLAQHSLEERQVVTETMAEVWEKQGNNEKAIDIYTKLSLLDPSKSAYFAAKIEGLKKIN